ncbi:MAG: M48 family metallopeptidase [Bacteroidetes bacterium]|nr:M48 family metallopeptidase [Bacteroidota bacterium]
MQSNLVRIALEEQLGLELFQLMEGDLLEEILSEGKIGKFENEWKYILEGHSFKATRELAPKLHELFASVVETLEFTEPVEFFINNSQEFNAWSMSSLEAGEPHIVNINAGLVDKLDDEELRFVVGHEIGHLITHNASIMKLINFVFPDAARIPVILNHKIQLWQKLAELSADRYGFIASPKLEKCVSGFFKLASGLAAERINFDYTAYLTENERILGFFRDNKAGNLMSHPINPIRIKGIQLFSNSETYRAILSKQPLEKDEILAGQINDLTQTLLVLSSSEADYHRKYFIASAGLVMAGVDGDMNAYEYETILKQLSDFTIFPAGFLEEIMQSGKVPEIMEKSAKALIDLNPGDRFAMFDMLMNVVIADKDISKDEIAFLYNYGESVFNFSRKEIAQMLANGIQQKFLPRIYS